jgi:UDPglucose--hexose-1-phosphate uridylyltransferase
MPELRLNIATNDWVIVATERAKRPHEFKTEKKEEGNRPSFLETCPFCVGIEAQNACNQIASINDMNGSWLVRSVPNKFPALSSKGEPEVTDKGVYHTINGVGAHEVIIETPVHNLTMARYRVSQVEQVIEMYRSRHLELSEDPRIAHIIIFKNHGESAGTSLEHPHSQIVATPVVPTQVKNRMRCAREYYEENRQCVFCTMVAEEIKAKERIVSENEHFIALVPYASFSPFHMWILPRRHGSSFGQIGKEEIRGLAVILKETLARLYYGVGNPDYNFCIRTSPIHERGEEYFHWYIAIIPRINQIAGFEAGSGMFINTSLPEQCAQFLREVTIPPESHS